MHSSAPHRARIIATPSAHAKPAPAAPSPQLRHQAERFRLLRAGSGPDATRKDARRAADPEMQPEPDSFAFVDDAPDQQHDGNDGDDANHNHSGDDGSDAPQPSEVDSDHAPEGCAPAHATLERHVGQTHRTHAPRQRGEAAAAVQAPADATYCAHRFVESIVEQVADFCSNPAVLARGHWDITIPIDPTLLPACTLRLTLSHFDLTLRFDTTDEGSRQLILQHAAMLREGLEQVMQTRFDTPRGIEIIIT